jgi:hypothetical protein
MIGVADWICDLLMSRGALVEPGGEGLVRAMLPADIAASLGAAEWLSLDLRSRAGGDDPVDWTERMERLLPKEPLLLGAQYRAASLPPPLDAAAVLSSELALQNGIFRVTEDSGASATYLVFTFLYTVESDDRSLGMVTVCVNAGARSVVAMPENFLRGIADGLREDDAALAPEAVSGLYAAASATARAAAAPHVTRIEEGANRRLARDAVRVESYYSGLLAHIGKRAARKAGDPAAAEKERARARATEADRVAKLQDLRHKYSLRIHTSLAAAMAVRVPVRRISVRLIRRREERSHILDWNTVLRVLDSPMCEHCTARAYPLYLCERVHLLCRECWTPCPGCSRFFCRVCQPRCKCGA